jgi:thioredoxin reductase (NADPH)
MSERPVLLVVDDDRKELVRLQDELMSRYSRHYDIVGRTSADEGMRVLRNLVEAGREIALVLTDQWMPTTTGVDFLAATKVLTPGTKRGLLVSWGAWREKATFEAIVEAMTLGHIDYYVLKPWRSPDELFHRTVTVFLHEWTRERPGGTPQLAVVGETWSRRSYELRDLLTRYRMDHAFYPVDSTEGRRVLAEAGATSVRLPVVALLNGRVLVDPSNHDLADAFGVRTRLDTDEIFDVMVIGAGPAGLAAAVYGSSEGLRTLVVEREAIGGQAGTSSLIRNYLGFAKGVSGAELAQQAYQQAWVFGTTFLMTRAATGISRTATGFAVELSNGEQAQARSIVLSTGASYRRLAVIGLERLIGAGVFYGASAAEAQVMHGREVFIVGGGNSAGQAALHLSRYAARVTILVRAQSLAESMSDYLITEIGAAPNIEVRFGTQVVAVGGEGRLEYLVLEDTRSPHPERVRADALFVLIGTQPHTSWLPAEIERDRWGFIVTGRDVTGSRPSWAPGDALDLESSMTGVFAAGDVRHGSVKRVASAVGEGSIVIRLIHEYLQRQEASAERAEW